MERFRQVQHGPLRGLQTTVVAPVIAERTSARKLPLIVLERGLQSLVDIASAYLKQKTMEMRILELFASICAIGLYGECKRAGS